MMSIASLVSKGFPIKDKRKVKEGTLINLIIPIKNTKFRAGQKRTTGHTMVGVRYFGGVKILC